MDALLALATLTGLYPLWRAWTACRDTTLTSTLLWAAVAQLGLAAAAADPSSPALAYLALCLAGCAGVAVLGARRPGAGAWNFVVGGLLAVLLLPVATGFGTPRLEPAHLIFLGGTLAVGVLNYLPTRPGPAVALVGVGVGLEMARLAGTAVPGAMDGAGRLAVALAPWAAWWTLWRQERPRAADRVWLRFRDGYGFLWAQRVREQFNRSAASAGLTVTLSWSGLLPADAADEAALAILRALLKRFGTVPEAAPSRDGSFASPRRPGDGG